MEPALIALIVIALLVIVVLAKSVTIVPQAQAKVIERLGRYSRTLAPGLNLLVPFVDRVRATIDLDVTVEPEAAPILRTMLEMFDLADALCKAAGLLSIQRTPEQRSFHVWYLTQYILQIDGEDPVSFRQSDPARSLGSQQVS